MTIRRRPLRSRILRAPAHWVKQYRIARGYATRRNAARVATLLTRVMLSVWRS